jgi:hypothetical protein
MKIGGVIRTAHERPRRDVLEAFVPRNATEELKLLGMDVLDDRLMIRRGPEILPERQHLAADLAQIVHRLE